LYRFHSSLRRRDYIEPVRPYGIPHGCSMDADCDGHWQTRLEWYKRRTWWELNDLCCLGTDTLKDVASCEFVDWLGSYRRPLSIKNYTVYKSAMLAASYFASDFYSCFEKIMINRSSTINCRKEWASFGVRVLSELGESWPFGLRLSSLWPRITNRLSYRKESEEREAPATKSWCDLPHIITSNHQIS
jgi:hypothetical protein